MRHLDQIAAVHQRHINIEVAVTVRNKCYRASVRGKRRVALNTRKIRDGTEVHWRQRSRCSVSAQKISGDANDDESCDSDTAKHSAASE